MAKLEFILPTVVGECGHIILIAPYEIKAIKEGATMVMCMKCETRVKFKGGVNYDYYK
jgi:hypothetical protein